MKHKCVTDVSEMYHYDTLNVTVLHQNIDVSESSGQGAWSQGSICVPEGPYGGPYISALEAPLEAPKIGRIGPYSGPSVHTQWAFLRPPCLSSCKFFSSSVSNTNLIST